MNDRHFEKERPKQKVLNFCSKDQLSFLVEMFRVANSIGNNDLSIDNLTFGNSFTTDADSIAKSILSLMKGFGKS